MKKLLYLVAASLLFASCEDFLDVKSYTMKDSSNFPESIEDAQQMLAGTYSTLNQAVASPMSTYFMVAELASDDRFGGGGENDKMAQALDLLMNYNTDMMKDFYATRYKGINRANTAIETMDNCSGDSLQKAQLKGEAYFLRALFNFELTSVFGEIVLRTNNEPIVTPKATADQIFAQIGSDLKNAIELMPAVNYTQVEAGHATRWAAQALLARTFLFYTGFYDKTEMPLAEGGSITKAYVIEELEKCIQSSGHQLVGDFRELWPYTNKYTVEDYPFTAGQGLVYAENDGNSSPETLFSIKFSNFPSWSTTIGYSNQYILYWGLRGGQSSTDANPTFPFDQGWGMGPVNPTLWEEWEAAEPSDMRRAASIIDLPNELPGYKKGGWNDFVQETDYWNKKYAPVAAKVPEGSEIEKPFVTDYSVLMYNTTENFQLDKTNDIILIRLADVYLMHSELTETNTYMNLVRARAGLDPIAYSLSALQEERRHELAFEGVRWNDIRRWGIAADVLDAQTGVQCYYKGAEETTKAFGGGYKARYNETKGFFPIPESEVLLTNDVIKQTPGWESQSSKYTGWN